MDQSFDAMVKLHNASSAAALRQQQLQQLALAQNQRNPKEGFFQNLYVNELKRSQEQLMQQQLQVPLQQLTQHAHQKLPLSPSPVLGRAGGFSTPPPGVLTPPLMAPKRQVHRPPIGLPPKIGQNRYLFRQY